MDPSEPPQPTRALSGGTARQRPQAAWLDRRTLRMSTPNKQPKPVEAKSMPRPRARADGATDEAPAAAVAAVATGLDPPRPETAGGGSCPGHPRGPPPPGALNSRAIRAEALLEQARADLSAANSTIQRLQIENRDLHARALLAEQRARWYYQDDRLGRRDCQNPRSTHRGRSRCTDRGDTSRSSTPCRSRSTLRRDATGS